MGKNRRTKIPLSEAGYSEDEILREAAKIMRSRQKDPPNPKVLRPCPKCSLLFGAAELRLHKPRCNGNPATKE